MTSLVLPEARDGRITFSLRQQVREELAYTRVGVHLGKRRSILILPLTEQKSVRFDASKTRNHCGSAPGNTSGFPAPNTVGGALRGSIASRIAVS